MRGSGDHQSSGSARADQGNMPRRYASSSRSSDRSPPAQRRPLGSLSARSTGGKGSSRPSQASTSALDLLAAVVLQRMHDAGIARRAVRRAAVLHRKPELVLGKKFVEELAAERADGVQLVALRVVLEQDRREGLRRRAGDDAGAFGRIVLAMLGAAVDD